ncbi:riboflavin synthase subunit beta [Lacinutrix undariae]
MGVFGKHKNKRYDYTPRFYKGTGSPFEMKGKFDDYRETLGSSKNFKGKLNSAVDDFKHNEDKQGANKRVLIIIGVLVLIFLFIIEFDLSIFF